MKKVLKLSIDFLEGPIWHDYFDREKKKLVTRIDVVDNDEIAQRLDKEIQDMYASYYEFDSHDQACWFNSEKEIEEAPKMLELINKLKARLEEINDGSYEVQDCISWQLKDLIKRYHK